VLANVSLYLILKWARFRINQFPFLYTIVTLGILLSVIFYGHFRIEKIKKANKNSIHLQVSLIQGNIDQAQKWDPSYTNETLATYQSLTVKAAQDHCDLIVWPETAVPCYFSPEHEYGSFLLSLAKKVNAPILFGSLAYEAKSQTEDYKYFNSAFLVSPEDKKVSRYDKVHLVPFGEYVPLKHFLPFVEKLVEGVGDFSPGKNFTLFAIPRARCGVLICYEIIFPNLSRNYCKSGANFLVTITNDAWFGRSSAPYQHFSMAVFRAVENRTAVLRAANSGISGIIEPTGYIQRQTPLFERTFCKGKIPVNSSSTFYSRYGDVGVALCGIVLLLFMLIGVIINKKNR
jgi:apolipoprotein N-acyltransferase